MRFVKFIAHPSNGGGALWINPEQVVTVRQHNDGIVNVSFVTSFARVKGDARDVIAALTKEED